MKKQLMILGNGPTRKKGLRIAQSSGMHCWGCNEAAEECITMIFQIHGDHFVNVRFKELMQMRPPKVPVVMQRHRPEFPTSVSFPMQDYMKFMRQKGKVYIDDAQNIGDDLDGSVEVLAYHACTMSYMVALGMMLGYNEIFIYGVDFYHEMRHESTFERPCVETHIFYGKAMGIDFHIPADSRLFTTCDNIRQTYGYEYNPPFKPEEIAEAYK